MKKTNENGITLIALVVTIVVLLILAGITITYVMADGGIFDSAKQAATATITSQIADYASQVQATYMTQMAVKTATGVTPAEGTTDTTGTIDKTVVQQFFPSEYTVSEASASGTKKGNLTGTATVQYKGIDYSVTWTEGIVKVEPPAAEE